MNSQPQELKDFSLDEQEIKFYPLMATELKKSGGVLITGATALVSCNEFEFPELEFDGDTQKPYFEALSASTVQTVNSPIMDRANVDSTLVNELQFSLLTNDWIQDMEDERIVFVTIDEPYDRDKYLKDEQKLFIITSKNAAGALEAQTVSANILEKDNLVELGLTNVNVWEAQAQINRIIPVLNVDWNTPILSDGTSGMSVSVSSTSLIHSLSAKGTVAGGDSSEDFLVEEKLTPFKATPVSTAKDKVTLFADWFDYDVTMPKFIIDNFINANTLKSLESITIGKNRNKFLSDDEISLIEDALCLSFAYATSFNWAPNLRYTEQEVKDLSKANVTGVKPGQLKAKYTITSKKIPIEALAGKPPIQAIDGIFERYIREHPDTENSNTYRAVKQLTAALSRYVYSTYAIGKGKNSFNEIYLPWVLRPSNTMSLTENKSNFTLSPNKFIATSHWFKIERGQIVLKDGINISDLQMIQTDRKLTVPNVPPQIGEMNKLPLPGDINTKSSNDLMYMWYLPVQTDDQMKKLFLNDPSVTTNNTNQKINIPIAATTKGRIYKDVSDAIIKAALAITSASRSQISIIDKGTISKQFTSETLSASKGQLINIANKYKPNKQSTRISGTAQYFTLTWTDDSVKKYILQDLFGYDRSTITNIVGDLVVEYNWRGKYTEPSVKQRFTYKVNNEHIIGAIVLLTGKITILTIDRDTLFDKRSWKKFLGNNNLLSTASIDLTLRDKYKENIDKITELLYVGIFNDDITINYNNLSISVPSINKYNETITHERFLFT